MQELDLGEPPVAEKGLLVDGAGPPGVRRAGEQAVEREVESATVEAGRGEDLGVRRTEPGVRWMERGSGIVVPRDGVFERVATPTDEG